jgi:hypothetical protein
MVIEDGWLVVAGSSLRERYPFDILVQWYCGRKVRWGGVRFMWENVE